MSFSKGEAEKKGVGLSGNSKGCERPHPKKSSVIFYGKASFIRRGGGFGGQKNIYARLFR